MNKTLNWRRGQSLWA